ncbi:hypothetical protein D3C86_2050140 [compost metagenome]
MEHDSLAAQHIGNSDLLTIFAELLFFESVCTCRNTAQAPQIVPVRQLDGMTDLLVIVI